MQLAYNGSGLVDHNTSRFELNANESKNELEMPAFMINNASAGVALAA